MPMPYPYDSWCGGYSIVNGKDSRSNTSYMWGGILAATLIRISSEFDSALSTTAGIQEANDDLPVEGGAIFIPPVTHDVSSAVVPSDNVFIFGIPKASIVRAAAGTNINVFALPSGASGVTIRDLIIDGQKALNPLFED